MSLVWHEIFSFLQKKFILDFVIPGFLVREILASNHQGSEEFSPIPGRLYAIEQPVSGNVFSDAWTTHIILDNIRPQPNLPGRRPPGRLAPGHAKLFYPHAGLEGRVKPWILLGGDEAGKVWMLKPSSLKRGNFNYRSAVIFDINQTYGAETTQTPTINGITLSTIGKLAVRNKPGKFGPAEIYIPVFEAKEIRVLSFAHRKEATVNCFAQ